MSSSRAVVSPAAAVTETDTHGEGSLARNAPSSLPRTDGVVAAAARRSSGSGSSTPSVALQLPTASSSSSSDGVLPKSKKSTAENTGKTSSNSSSRLHDVYMTARLEAYSDAIFSVAATLMVWPLQVATPLPADTDLPSYLESKIPEFLIYLASFVVSANIWTSHVRMFRIIKHVDDFVTWMNLLCLLLISFIPFSCTLMGRYSSNQIAIGVAALNIFLVVSLQLAIILYVTKRAHLLTGIAKKVMHSNTKATVIQCIPFIIVLLLSIAAIVFEFASPYIAWSLLFLLLFAPLANYFASRYIRRHQGFPLLLVSDSPFRDGAVDLERLQSFSDGVFSVAATLLVLNVEIPDSSTTKNEDLASVLMGLWPDYLAFVGSFVLVGILWHIHHVIHFYIDRCTTLMVVLNNFSLAFVGFIPFCTSLITDFARTATAGEIIVVQFAAGTIFVAALLQALIWVYALALPRTRTTKRRVLGVAAESSAEVRFFVSLKVIIVPFNCVLVFVCSFASYSISYIVFHLTLFLTPVLLLLARLAVGGKLTEHYHDDGLDDEDSIDDERAAFSLTPSTPAHTSEQQRLPPNHLIINEGSGSVVSSSDFSASEAGHKRTFGFNGMFVDDEDNDPRDDLYSSKSFLLDQSGELHHTNSHTDLRGVPIKAKSSNFDASLSSTPRHTSTSSSYSFGGI